MITMTLLNQVLHTAFTDSDRTYYIGLSSVAPARDGTGYEEPTAPCYSRIPVGSFSAPENGVVHNTSALDFPVSMDNWFSEDKPATHWVLFDGEQEGSTLLACGELTSAYIISKGMSVTIPAGSLDIVLVDMSSDV